MLHALAALLFFLAQPFWETKPPEQWTDREIDIMLGSSPWAQSLGPSPELTVWLATAEPMEAAEDEARLHKRNPMPEPDPDYLDFMRENRDKAFVLAVAYPEPERSGQRSRRMDNVGERNADDCQPQEVQD